MDAYGGEEEGAELRQVQAELDQDIDNFEKWEKLIQCAEGLEGGLNRNSSSQAITSVRSAYDRFLAKFPLLFGYWKKYAELEFSIVGTEAAELVYERGISSVPTSVDLWTSYCSFKLETCHDQDSIREVFERAAATVGLDWQSYVFWDKYLEFEERWSQTNNIHALLERIIHIPNLQHGKYFEVFRKAYWNKPVAELKPADVLQKMVADLDMEGVGYKSGRSQVEIEQELRTRIDQSYIAIYQATQVEIGKRQNFETKIKRPYFHVIDLDESEVEAWREYLDFEESEGDYVRTQFLYERCLTTLAFYEEFWLRYARWMFFQEGKEEEVRNIYQRASCLFVPIALPEVRLQYAYFEEMSGRYDVAKDIHDAILDQLPDEVNVIVSLSNLVRRQEGVEAAIGVLRRQLEKAECAIATKAAVVAAWAKILWRNKGAAEEARQVYQQNQNYYLESSEFWSSYLNFEIDQSSTATNDETGHKKIKQVVNDLLHMARLPAPVLQDLVKVYMKYLLENGSKDAAKEYMDLDREINGPASVRKARRADPAASAKIVNGKPRIPQTSR